MTDAAPRHGGGRRGADTARIRFRGPGAPTLLAVLLVTTAVFGVGLAIRTPCTVNGWAPMELVYRYGCYTDLAPLYGGRGLADGLVPYLERPADGRYLEYPVLTGAVMVASAWVAGPGTPGDTTRFVFVTYTFLWLAALVTAAATWATRPRGPTAALMFALSPGLLLTATINWDLIAVAFTALAVWAWNRDRALLTGLLVGAGAAAKFYPLLLLGPLLVICLRDRRWRDLGLAVGGAVGSWLVVNLPVMVFAFDGWREFYVFSSTRGEDFGSPWYAASLLGWGSVPSERINVLAAGIFLLLCVLVAVLGLLRRASFAQLAFLVVAAFLLTNKVYSPQYVLWLVPLAALARPRWPAFLAWQAAEAVYWAAVWRYLLGYSSPLEQDGAITGSVYAWAIWLHVVATLGFAAVVVVDVVRGRPGGDDSRAALDGEGQSSPTTTSGLATV